MTLPTPRASGAPLSRLPKAGPGVAQGAAVLGAPGVVGPRVLVIEDQSVDRLKLKAALSRLGCQVIEAPDGETGLVEFQRARPQVVILDLMLPGMDGFEVCRRMRALSEDTAILMLTSRGEEAMKAKGLDLGADDYLVKPWNPLELGARMRAVLRRTQWRPRGGEGLAHGPFTVAFRTRKACKDQVELDLTQREFSLLMIFLQQPGKTLTREAIHAALWGEHHHGSAKALDVYIRRLRQKIEADPSAPRHLKTVWGVGFVFE